jgi:hypothetical protein
MPKWTVRSFCQCSLHWITCHYSMSKYVMNIAMINALNFTVLFNVLIYADLISWCIQEWGIYCNFDLSLIEYSNLEEFWKKVSHNHLPLLSQIALDYIWIPISSCSVERSFSVYNNILSEDRENLSQDSLQMLNTLYFNCM